MNKYIEGMLSHRRLIISTVGMMVLCGVSMWLTMVRQEDPRLPDYWGQVVITYPGADAGKVEHLLLEPAEEALVEVAEIKKIESTAYDEVAVMTIELKGHVKDFDHAWEEVRKALGRARQAFPEGANAPVLDEEQMDQDSVVLAVNGVGSLLKLLDGARRLEERFQRMPLVKRTHLIAAPTEQITIAMDDAAARRLDVTAAELAARLKKRNLILPGGSLALGGKTVRLRPLSEFTSLEVIAHAPIVLESGSAVPLSSLARV